MFGKINEIPHGIGNVIIDNSKNILYTLLEKWCTEIDEQSNLIFNVVTANYISKMNRTVTKDRLGIG